MVGRITRSARQCARVCLAGRLVLGVAMTGGMVPCETDADTVTDPKQSQLFYDSAKTASSDKEFHLLPGARHVDGFHGGPTQTQLMQSVIDRIKTFIAATGTGTSGLRS